MQRDFQGKVDKHNIGVIEQEELNGVGTGRDRVKERIRGDSKQHTPLKISYGNLLKKPPKIYPIHTHV